MRKSIFIRYFALACAIIIVCFTILGALFVTFAANYWTAEKEQMYIKNATQLAATIGKDGVLRKGADGNYYYSVPSMAKTAMAMSAEALGAEIFMVYPDGGLYYCTEDEACLHEMRMVPESVMKKAVTGTFYEVGRLDDYFDETQYTAASPVVLEKTGDVLGVLFVSSDAGGVSNYISDVLRLFILAGLFVMLFSFCAVYLMTYRMVKPLRQMAQAARRFGEGDFSFRVPIKGHDELSELATAFNGMATSLASLEDMRRSFVGNVSHELKTPMTTIAGFVDGILDGTIPPNERDKYLNIVSHEVKRLSRMVRTMLDISRMEAGELKMNPVSFDISNMVFQILFSLEAGIEAKKIEIEGLEELKPITVNADSDMMHQCIYNLIENAVKFTNEEGTIQIRVTEDERNVQVAIKNSGEGIAARELPLIFDRFYKSDKSRGRDKTGVGLGLYIVQMLISLHGGEITVRSVEGEYCEFEFYIPKNTQAPKLR